MNEKGCKFKSAHCCFSTENSKNIIARYYDGELDEAQGVAYSVNELNPDDHKKNMMLYERIKDLLDEDGNTLFEEFLESQLIMQGHHEVERFTKGFQWGAMFITLDVFGG